MQINEVQLTKITKNTTAIVYVDGLISTEQRKQEAERLTEELGCKVVVFDRRQQVLFVEMKTGKKQAELETLVAASQLPEQVKDQLKEWLAYKKYKYEPKGFEKLLKITAKKVQEFGEAAVCDLIDVSMANMWVGICWDRLKPTTPAARQPQAGGGVFDRIDQAVNGLGSYGK